jgi:uroporphyrinogen-III synthase
MNDGLAGKRVVNTRGVHQAPDLDRLLTERGAIPVAFPCVAIAPPDDTSALESEVRQLVGGAYDWLALTSVNAVEAISLHLAALGLTPLSRLPCRIAAVGPATAAAVQRHLGWTVDLVPEEHSAASLAAAIPAKPGERVLLPASAIARRDLKEGLERLGAHVTVVTAYRTVRGSGGADVPRLLADREIDAITFASSSAVEGFFERLQQAGGSERHLDGVVLACIGAGTAATLRKWVEVDPVVPPQSTLAAMVDALARVFSNQRTTGRTQ